VDTFFNFIGGYIMATKDLYHPISPAISLVPDVRTADENGRGVDVLGFESALVVVATGTIIDGKHTIELQESYDNEFFTAVADEDFLGMEPIITDTASSKTYKVGYIGNQRYIRVVTTVENADEGGVYSAVVLRSNARHQPV
jgi:hypothetical protein